MRCNISELQKNQKKNSKCILDSKILNQKTFLHARNQYKTEQARAIETW